MAEHYRTAYGRTHTICRCSIDIQFKADVRSQEVKTQLITLDSTTLVLDTRSRLYSKHWSSA